MRKNTPGTPRPEPAAETTAEATRALLTAEAPVDSADPPLPEDRNDDEAGGAAAPPARRRRRGLVIGLCCAVALAGGVTAWQLSAAETARQAAAARPAPAHQTEAVTLAPLVTERQLTGTLRFDQPRTLASGLGGVVTGLPAAGSVIGEGGELFAIANRPVLLVTGSLPAWRDFAPGMSRGPDIEQLEGFLLRAGIFDGDVDELFTDRTAAGIRALQRDQGQPQTGVLELGSVVFQPAEVLIASHSVAVGASVAPGAGIATVSAQQRVVQLDLRVEDLGLAQVGAAATVTLPDGSSVGGSVRSVDSPAAPVAAAEPPGEGAPKPPTVPVIVQLADQGPAAAFPQSTVTVSIVGAESEPLLSVPVAALVALDDQRFAVEVPDAAGALTRVEVSTGLFAAGRVEVSGTGIAEGTRVVVPTR